VREALATARGFQLSAYDAVYLELARDEAIALATLDKSLRSAATKAGVELVS
jgi:predicted nucleic acid-binding protein